MNNDLILIQDKINTHKSDLAANLATKSVNANSSETLAVLIGKVKDIEQGGGGSGEGGLDWSQITNMKYAFYMTSAQVFEILINSINCDMSQVTEWDYSFYGAIQTTNANEAFQNKNIKFNKINSNMFNKNTYLTDVNIGDSLVSPSDCSNAFTGCKKLNPDIIKKVLNASKTGRPSFASAFQNVGNDLTDKAGTLELGDIEFNSGNIDKIFDGVLALKSVGNIHPISGSSTTDYSYMFNNCTNLENVGTLTIDYRINSTDLQNLIYGCKNIVKFGGVIFKDVTKQVTTITNYTSNLFLGNTSFTKLEELINIPVGYFNYGGTNIGNLAGTASAPKALRKLVFNYTENGYLFNKGYAKNLDIKYCSFARDGMVEMFNTLPDANDVTGTKVITITGNPCVVNGTLTEEDIAIATAKGYTVTT
jgi:hypothetical protein